MLPSTGQTHTHTHTHKDFYTNCLMFKRKNNQTKWKKQEKCQRYRNIYIEVCCAMQIQMARDSVHQRHAI